MIELLHQNMYYTTIYIVVHEVMQDLCHQPYYRAWWIPLPGFLRDKHKPNGSMQLYRIYMGLKGVTAS